MRESRYRALAWTLRRLAISGFIVVHLCATLLWVLPVSPLRNRFFGVVSGYIFPLGLWQYWGMFAPDPMRDSLTLEAQVVDSRGIRTNFAFEKGEDNSVLRGMPRYRHPKFAANLLMPDNLNLRTIAAKHALRKLDVPAEAYPVSVHLIYQVRVTPPPGGPPVDPMTPNQTFVLGAYQFASLSEVRP